MDDEELAALVAVIACDAGFQKALSIEHRKQFGRPYFSIPIEDVRVADGSVFAELFSWAAAEITDFRTYFRCLCELHKRRRKYAVIKRHQPLPTDVQVAPRALLEYGEMQPELLGEWLTIRKYVYDLDNRAAQETGYLFEPILAHAIGGCPTSAKKSPVRRRADAAKGRQIDCLLDRDAYEFKLRVTIAASGQGRFAERVDFAEDCLASGYRPVLVVLDPTPNARLTDLVKAYEAVGGTAYIGDGAWKHLESRAGPLMSRFIEMYIRRPIDAVAPFIGKPFSMRLGYDKGLHLLDRGI